MPTTTRRGAWIHAIKKAIQTTRAMITDYISSPRSHLRSHVATALLDTEFDVSSYVSFPKEDLAKLHPNSPKELLNGKFRRRTHVV